MMLDNFLGFIINISGRGRVKNSGLALSIPSLYVSAPVRYLVHRRSHVVNVAARSKRFLSFEISLRSLLNHGSLEFSRTVVRIICSLGSGCST